MGKFTNFDKKQYTIRSVENASPISNVPIVDANLTLTRCKISVRTAARPRGLWCGVELLPARFASRPEHWPLAEAV
jgi:hypothetical protein